MGLFSALFKTEQAKSEPEGGKTEPSGAALPAVENPPELKDPEPANREIALELGDVLTRIPAHFLHPGPHDRTRALRFQLDDLFSNIARGRATVPLSRIAEYCPEIFSAPITSAEDIDIPLPLQKVVEQIGKFPERERTMARTESRFAQIAMEGPLISSESDEAKNAAFAKISEAAPSRNPPNSPEDLPAKSREKSDFADQNTGKSSVPLDPAPAVPQSRPTTTTTTATTSTNMIQEPPPASSQPSPALTMTRPDLNHDQIVKTLTELGGITACIISSKNRLTLTGEIPSEFDIQKFRESVPDFLRSVETYAGQMKLGPVRNVSMNCEKFMVSFFSHRDLSLCVFHREQNLLPGVREKLSAITDDSMNGQR
jgi:hypothetical protein